MARKKFDPKLARMSDEFAKLQEKFERHYNKMRRQLMSMEEARQAMKRLAKRIAQHESDQEDAAPARRPAPPDVDLSPLVAPAPDAGPEGKGVSE